MTLVDLYARAEQQGIDVDDVPMRVVASLSCPEGWIAMDSRKIETEREEKVLLAHEIGHIETGSFYNVYSKFDVRAKHEHRADARAIKILVPYRDLRKAVRSGIHEVWELAEHFGVTEWFIKKALALYADKYNRA